MAVFQNPSQEVLAGKTITYVSVENIASGVTVIAREVSANSTTGSQSTSATNVVLLSANADRTGVSIINDSDQIAYIKLDNSAATTSDYTVQLPASSGATVLYETPFGYTGEINVIFAGAGTGSLVYTEFTV